MSKGTIKNRVSNFYLKNGQKMGKFVLINTIISAVALLALCVFGKFGLVDWIAMILAIPLVSLIITVTRIALKALFKIANFRSVIFKAIISIFAFVFFGLGILSGFRHLENMSDWLVVVIMSLFDAVYIAIIVFLFKARENTQATVETQKENISE